MLEHLEVMELNEWTWICGYVGNIKMLKKIVIPEHCDGQFEYAALVSSAKIQLTPSMVSHKRYNISVACVFGKSQMDIAHNMPFRLPLAIGASGTKGFKERWKTLFVTVIRQYSWNKPLKTDDIEEIPNSNETDDPISSERRRTKERLRLISLVIDLIAMTAGVFVCGNSFISGFPYSTYDSTLDTRYVPVSYDGISYAFDITDWSSVDIPNDYNSCMSFLPPISSISKNSMMKFIKSGEQLSESGEIRVIVKELCLMLIETNNPIIPNNDKVWQ
ncbi:hypothetical protein Glove_251g38 [Diversispora epigaea]|uniref:Uncharacterized protein n=1 Tax=Diversispora epigaea TaxID=1348612 RepID=A0A397I7W6_9GLOM|nr:hypothetical protein Glove_251g38 [Diversispora epigaea]